MVPDPLLVSRARARRTWQGAIPTRPRPLARHGTGSREPVTEQDVLCLVPVRSWCPWPPALWGTVESRSIEVRPAMRQMHRSENARRISRILRHCYGWVCCQPSCFLTRGHIHQTWLQRSRLFGTNDTYEHVYVWLPALPALGEKDWCGFDERRTTTTTTTTKRTTGSPRVLRDRGDRSNAALQTRQTRRRGASKSISAEELFNGFHYCSICFVRVSMSS